MKTRNTVIDVWKFICAVSVVMIHSVLFQSELNDVQVFVRWVFRLISPVEFFVMVTAYYLFKSKTDSEKRIEKCKKYCYKLLKSYIVWSVIYAPIWLPSCFKNTEGIDFKSIIENIVFGFYHLWYLPATVLSLFVIGILLLKNKTWLAWTLALSSQIVYVLLSAYSNIFGLDDVVNAMPNKSIYFIRIPIYIIFAYYVALISEKKDRIKIDKKIISVLIIVLFLYICELSLGELFITGQDLSNNITKPFKVLIVFWVILNCDVRLPKKFAIFLGNASKWIYFLHIWVISILKKLNLFNNEWLFMIFAVAFSLIITIFEMGFNRIYKKNSF